MRSWRWHLTARFAACVLLATAVIAPDGSDHADAIGPRQFVSGWFPVWSTVGLTALRTNQGNEMIMADASPFNYSVTGATTFSMSSSYTTNLTTVTRELRARGLKVIPSLTDGISVGQEEGMAIMLRDQMDAHVAAIVTKVMTGVDGIAFDGIDLDYEGFAFNDAPASWSRTKPIWVDFVGRLGAALHAQGKLLSVTVPVGVSVSTSYSVYNWRGIIPSIDRFRLMTYDYSWSVPGPVSPVDWVQSAITYVKGLVVELGRDPQMVQIGVPTYGRNWATVVAGTCPTSVLQRTDPTMRLAVTLAASNGVTPVRHASGELTFSYEEQFTAGGVRLGASNVPVEARTEIATAQGERPVPAPAPATMAPLAAPNVSPSALAAVRGSADDGVLVPALRLGICRVRRTVFYPDEWTVVQRARMALDAGLGGIAIWAHGYESPEMWPLLRALGDEYAR